LNRSLKFRISTRADGSDGQPGVARRIAGGGPRWALSSPSLLCPTSFASRLQRRRRRTPSSAVPTTGPSCPWRRCTNDVPAGGFRPRLVKPASESVSAKAQVFVLGLAEHALGDELVCPTNSHNGGGSAVGVALHLKKIALGDRYVTDRRPRGAAARITRTEGGNNRRPVVRAFGARHTLGGWASLEVRILVPSASDGEIRGGAPSANRRISPGRWPSAIDRAGAPSSALCAKQARSALHVDWSFEKAVSDLYPLVPLSFLVICGLDLSRPSRRRNAPQVALPVRGYRALSPPTGPCPGYDHDVGRAPTTTSEHVGPRPAGVTLERSGVHHRHHLRKAEVARFPRADSPPGQSATSTREIRRPRCGPEPNGPKAADARCELSRRPSTRWASPDRARCRSRRNVVETPRRTRHELLVAPSSASAGRALARDRVVPYDRGCGKRFGAQPTWLMLAPWVRIVRAHGGSEAVLTNDGGGERLPLRTHHMEGVDSR